MPDPAQVLRTIDQTFDTQTRESEVEGVFYLDVLNAAENGARLRSGFANPARDMAWNRERAVIFTEVRDVFVTAQDVGQPS